MASSLTRRKAKESPTIKVPGGKAGNPPVRVEQPIIAFASAAKFSRWLAKHHVAHQGIWMRIYKKGSGRATVTYAEALDIALCHGWIDGQKKRGDKESWLQKFTRRGSRSVWSKVNVGNIDRLTREGRMKPAGVMAVDAARADGRWENAYHPSSTAEAPAEFLQALSKSRKAEAFFRMLSKANRYSFLYRIHNAKKAETRVRRIKEFILMLARGETFNPQPRSKITSKNSK